MSEAKRRPRKRKVDPRQLTHEEILYALSCVEFVDRMREVIQRGTDTCDPDGPEAQRAKVVVAAIEAVCETFGPSRLQEAVLIEGTSSCLIRCMKICNPIQRAACMDGCQGPAHALCPHFHKLWPELFPTPPPKDEHA